MSREPPPLRDWIFVSPPGSGRADIGISESLVAAAPDLLAALKGIQDFAQQTVTDLAADLQEGGQLQSDEFSRWNNVLSAIAKAEGR